MREKTIRQLCGQDFDIVKEGLDESQVEAFVTQLATERNMLLQRQDHLLALTKLAERTVAEADNLAADIKRETEKEAQDKATAIISKAEQDAREYMEQKRTEILTTAGREADGIRANARQEADATRANARQEAELLAQQYRQRAEENLKLMIQKVHGQLISGLKEVMGQAMALQPEWEHKLSESITSDFPQNGDGERPTSFATPTTPPPKIEKVAGSPPGPGSDSQTDVLAKLEQAWTDSDASANPGKPPAAPPPPTAAHKPDTDTAKLTAVVLDKETAVNTFQGTLELCILPPLSATQLVEIQSYLRRWPGIGIRELRPNNNGCSIKVTLDRPMQLIDILKQLPEVKDARECSGKDGLSSPGAEKLKRIEVTVR